MFTMKTCFAVIFGLFLMIHTTFAANVLITSRNGAGGGSAIDIGIRSLPDMGRACGKIGGAVVGQDPVGACNPLNGAIPPDRIIGFIDATGNRVDAESDLAASLFGVKTFFVSATSTAVTKNTFAQAEFVDPLTFFSPTNDAFDIDLIRSFESLGPEPSLKLTGSASTGEHASGSYYAEMSTNLTGFLFSLDLGFLAGEPLSVLVTLGSYVAGLPGWDKTILENSLRTLLDANTADDNFSLSSFSFPDIPVHVPVGAELTIATDDIATVNATVSEPDSLILLISGLAGILARERKARVNRKNNWGQEIK